MAALFVMEPDCRRSAIDPHRTHFDRPLIADSGPY